MLHGPVMHSMEPDMTILAIARDISRIQHIAKASLLATCQKLGNKAATVRLGYSRVLLDTSDRARLPTHHPKGKITSLLG